MWNNRDTSSGGYQRNDKGERAATAKGYLAMRAATRERMISITALVLVISIGFLVPKAAAQSDKYSKMAPVDQYLMERNAEILLARSAAPDSISSDATILVLGRQGYETAVRGKNGFVCMVERSWMAAFDSPEFWNPKVKGAECLNRQAVRSILPIADLRTRMVMAGHCKAEIVSAIKAAFDKQTTARSRKRQYGLHDVEVGISIRRRGSQRTTSDVLYRTQRR